MAETQGTVAMEGIAVGAMVAEATAVVVIDLANRSSMGHLWAPTARLVEHRCFRLVHALEYPGEL